ncbi:hypothetical protein Micbo1qcDRAFT_160426 [Microdochium bolleyi]|uniref:Uncharacterized protein n=1 Tax=Microdochium bolleyi TaxID=196109 RepID=A0A136J6L9_9PEZI|nr:hypothetical protein Micbo1qcDRAFT_160426 [Microdochium bolleyi]
MPLCVRVFRQINPLYVKHGEKVPTSRKPYPQVRSVCMFIECNNNKADKLWPFGETMQKLVFPTVVVVMLTTVVVGHSFARHA